MTKTGEKKNREVDLSGVRNGVFGLFAQEKTLLYKESWQMN